MCELKGYVLRQAALAGCLENKIKYKRYFRVEVLKVQLCGSSNSIQIENVSITL